MNTLNDLARQHADFTGHLGRRAALRLALAGLVEGTDDVGWVGSAQDTHGVRLQVIDGGRSGALQGLLVPPGLGLTGKVLLSTRSEWVDHYSESQSITHTFDGQIEQEGIHRLLAAPLMWDGRVLGVIAVGSRSDGRYGGRSIERIERIAAQAALAESIADGAAMAKELAVQNERTRLSAELHDGVGALLYAIGSRAEGIAALVGASDPELAREIKQLRSHAAEAASALRDSLRMLRSNPTSMDLVTSLDGDRLAFSDRSGIPAELVVLDTPPAIPPSRTDAVISGVREALLNVEKHAEASAVVITVVTSPGWLTVAVTDDGTGLSALHQRGIGLDKTAAAAQRLGGKLEVMSPTSGDGTTWRMRLPL